MKFGGAALGTSAGLEQVLSIIADESRNWERLLVVVSALDGVTDMLLDAAQFARIDHPRGYRRIAANLRTRHLALIDQLPLDRPDRRTLQADIDQLLSGLLDDCLAIANNLNEELSPIHSDTVVAVGERLSARIIAALLRQNGIRGVAVDGTDVLITDDVHGNANPDFGLTAQRVDAALRPILQRDMIPVVTGYIGATAAGVTTTLGRGGTDFTASVISATLEADELWIWTDVDGMMTADPRQLPDARVVADLGYSEAADFAYFGAKILHARMIAPLAEVSLPLRIKNIFQPGAGRYLDFGGPRARQADDQSGDVGAGACDAASGERFAGGSDAAGGQYVIQDAGHAFGGIDRFPVVEQQLHLPGHTDQHRHRRRRSITARLAGEDG